MISPELMVSLPQPLMVGVEIHRGEGSLFRMYMDGGYFKYPLSGDGKMAISTGTLESGFRLSPFQSWWSLSVGVGYRQFKYATNSLSSFSIDDEVLATEAAINLSTFYFSPMLEAKVNLSKSWELAFGLGVQIPIVGSGSITLLNSNDGTNSDNSDLLAVDSGNYISRVARLIVPRVTLFRLTWHW
jgi:hypothetical protein